MFNRLTLDIVEPFQGMVIYKGTSNINKKPIIVIATGLHKQSQNPKTGEMVQIYILNANEHPTSAALNGNDASICGDCPHKITNNGTCYVNISFGPRGVWTGLQNGKYPKVTLYKARKLLAGKMVRLGSYGDPCAVPIKVWDIILQNVAGWTGYTHQWRKKYACKYKKYLMASCDNLVELYLARKKGWRTFRVRNSTDELMPGEFICPASKEAGHRLTCAECSACNGVNGNKNRVSPSIVVHGWKFKISRFARMNDEVFHANTR